MQSNYFPIGPEFWSMYEIVFQKLSKNYIDTGHSPDLIFVAEKIIRTIELIFDKEI